MVPEFSGQPELLPRFEKNERWINQKMKLRRVIWNWNPHCTRNKQSVFSSIYDKNQRGVLSCLMKCQKTLVLSKVTDQMAYYIRQLYCYNLSVVKGLPSDSLNPENVSIYSWPENELLWWMSLWPLISQVSVLYVRLQMDALGKIITSILLQCVQIGWKSMPLLPLKSWNSYILSLAIFSSLQAEYLAWLKNNWQRPKLKREDYYSVFQKYRICKRIAFRKTKRRNVLVRDYDKELTFLKSLTYFSIEKYLKQKDLNGYTSSDE